MSGIIGKNSDRSSGVIDTVAGGIASLAADSSPQLGGFLDANGNYIQMQKGGDISSASPTVIDTDGDYFAVTGTTNFSAFTVAADRHFFLEFGGALTMTHGNGTLDLPGAANITTAASDVGEFVSTAANVVTCINYTKRDGTPVALASIRSIPQNSKSAAYTTVLTDAGNHIYHPGGDTTARTWTIDSNANVAYPIGSVITFVNDTSGGVITISITSDTLVLSPDSTTGNRTLAANGIATAIKMTATRWMISGSGLT
jgi:hypothetical protein